MYKVDAEHVVSVDLKLADLLFVACFPGQNFTNRQVLAHLINGQILQTQNMHCNYINGSVHVYVHINTQFYNHIGAEYALYSHLQLQITDIHNKYLNIKD